MGLWHWGLHWLYLVLVRCGDAHDSGPRKHLLIHRLLVTALGESGGVGVPRDRDDDWGRGPVERVHAVIGHHFQLHKQHKQVRECQHLSVNHWLICVWCESTLSYRKHLKQYLPLMKTHICFTSHSTINLPLSLAPMITFAHSCSRFFLMVLHFWAEICESWCCYYYNQCATYSVFVWSQCVCHQIFDNPHLAVVFVYAEEIWRRVLAHYLILQLALSNKPSLET